MNARTLEITPEFQEALNLLHAGASLFLTGRAGTGKSTLIRTFMQQTKRDTLVVAPTGIAALNVNGDTIHRLFGFRPGVSPEFVRSDSYAPKRLAAVLANAPVLIVDEASMVRADLFDSMMAALEKLGPRPGTAFGGIQLVLVGDLFQLPPVVTDSEHIYFSTAYESPFFFSANKYSPEHFHVVELQKVFRQQGDSSLVNLLNAVRDGSMGEADRQRLNALVRPGFIPPLNENWLTLTTSNAIAHARNLDMLNQIPMPQVTAYAHASGDLEGFDAPTDTELKLKVGAQVMLLSNNPDGEWVNGSLGQIAHMAFDPESGAVDSLGVRLASGRTATVHSHTWEVTRASVRGGTLTHEPVGSFSQFPLKLAWAITIHKSQGQTLDRCVVDLSGGTFADGQLYVALSRCTSTQGLVLTQEVRPRDLKVSQRIRSFLSSRGNVTQGRGTAYIGICTVGEVSRITRPRPIEIAVVTDDGNEISTLVNPGRDIGDARAQFGISASDVVLAPTLDEAWQALGPFLAGRAAVGVDINQVLQNIDYELKRGEMLYQVPVGSNVPLTPWPDASSPLVSGTALDRARAARDVDQTTPITRTSTDIFPAPSPRLGYLLPRDSVGNESARFYVNASEDREQKLAELLAPKAAVASTDSWATRALMGVSVLSGVPVFSSAASSRPRLVDVFAPGAGICFTGSAYDLEGNPVSREELQDLAAERGLVIENSVTKKRCNILVSAESGSQSGKAATAAKFGIPVFTAQEFLEFIYGVEPEDRDLALEPLRIAVDSVPVPTKAGVAL